jgi:2-dehydropantoate 2-reductase
MRPASLPLRIAVLGVGNIGSAFAFQLSRVGGHDVTAIARPGSLRLAQLQRDRAIVDIHGERASVRVASSLDEEASYDLLIVTLLAHQMAPLLPALSRSKASCIQFMFNTFQPEALQAAVGEPRCAFGMPFIQSLLVQNGRLKADIGRGGQKSIMSRQACVDVFNAAGLPAALEPDMPRWLRCHAPLCVAFESVSVAGERRGGGATWDEALTLARGVHASFTLIKSLGYGIYPRAKKSLDGSPAWVMAAMLWFMSRIRSFRQLLATGEIECGALVEVMVAAAPWGTSKAIVSRIAAMKPS